MTLLIKTLRRGLEKVSALALKAQRQLEELKEKGEGVTGVPTGFDALDKITNGFQPSDLIIVAARPGMGKTSFILTVARNAAIEYDRPVATVFA